VVGVTADALVRLTDNELRALLAHELGHHAGLDALPKGLVIWYLALIEACFRPTGSRTVSTLLRLVYRPVVSILSLVSRTSEFAADAFASRLGYGQALESLLMRLHPNQPPTLTAAILDTHPAATDRIQRLRSDRP
jgi:Zn-dependent protease with chaperone function